MPPMTPPAMAPAFDFFFLPEKVPPEPLPLEPEEPEESPLEPSGLVDEPSVGVGVGAPPTPPPAVAAGIVP